MATVRGEQLNVDGKVSKAATDFRVLEDGALAYQLQEKEYAGHYSGNITRNRTVRQDIRTAKDVAEEEALQAFKEEHEQVERNREIEKRDEEAAKELYRQMLQEERSKMHKQRSIEDEDQDIAKKLQEHEKKKAALMRQKHNSILEESDEDVAKRIQAHEERKAAILRQRQQESDAALARQISQSERPKLPSTPVSPGADINCATASLSLLEDSSVPVYPAPPPPLPPKDNTKSPSLSPESEYETPMEVRMRGEVDTRIFDDDDMTNSVSLDDADMAKRLQQEEIKRSRRQKQRNEMSEDELKRLQHDQRIARKMQHEEVMIAKNKYHRYKERVDNEIASPEPMTHVSRSNKVAVTADAKYDQGVTLTDYKPGEGSQMRRASDTTYKSNGQTVNVAAAIDPTHNAPDSGNVLLMHHRRSLNDGPPPGSPPDEIKKVDAEVDENIAPIQGTRRKKEGKKKSIFSKLKKK